MGNFMQWDAIVKDFLFSFLFAAPSSLDKAIRAPNIVLYRRTGRRLLVGCFRIMKFFGGSK
jgi:hypothetical protein